jgi:hypothetical protein
MRNETETEIDLCYSKSQIIENLSNPTGKYKIHAPDQSS